MKTGYKSSILGDMIISIVIYKLINKKKTISAMSYTIHIYLVSVSDKYNVQADCLLTITQWWDTLGLLLSFCYHKMKYTIIMITQRCLITVIILMQSHLFLHYLLCSFYNLWCHRQHLLTLPWLWTHLQKMPFLTFHFVISKFKNIKLKTNLMTRFYLLCQVCKFYKWCFCNFDFCYLLDQFPRM